MVAHVDIQRRCTLYFARGSLYSSSRYLACLCSGRCGDAVSFLSLKLWASTHKRKSARQRKRQKQKAKSKIKSLQVLFSSSTGYRLGRRILIFRPDIDWDAWPSYFPSSVRFFRSMLRWECTDTLTIMKLCSICVSILLLFCSTCQAICLILSCCLCSISCTLP